MKIKLDRDFVYDEVVAHEAIIEKIRVRNPGESRDEMHKHIKKVHEKLETAYNSIMGKDMKSALRH